MTDRLWASANWYAHQTCYIKCYTPHPHPHRLLNQELCKQVNQTRGREQGSGLDEINLVVFIASATGNDIPTSLSLRIYI